MSSELQEIDDTGIRAAFAGYSEDPGGGIRLDTGAIAVAGKRRVRRNRLVAGAAGAVAVVALFGGVATAAQLIPGHRQNARPDTVAAGGELPTTGRDVTQLFGNPNVGTLDAPIKAGGDAVKIGRGVAGDLDPTPAYLDAAWQAGPDGPKAESEWVLLTWADGDKAAEGLLRVLHHPIYTAIYPPPYTTCQPIDKAGGRSCEVRNVSGKGWLKVVRGATGRAPELTVSLQRPKGKDLISLSLRPGAATKTPLADGRKALGRLPVGEQDVIDAVLNIP